MLVSEIKKELAKFEVFQCGLYHEIIKLDSNTKFPLKKTVSNEDIYTRVALCNTNKRKYRLGCAHSSSNTKFNYLISLLETGDSEIKNIQNQINKIISKIYLLDHKKGHLEKDFAISLENNSKSINQIQDKILECKETHKNFLNELSDLKKSLLLMLSIN